jgi:hypothetical protein
MAIADGFGVRVFLVRTQREIPRLMPVPSVGQQERV